MTLKQDCTNSYLNFAKAYRDLLKRELDLEEFPQETFDTEVFTEKGTENKTVTRIRVYTIFDVDDEKILELEETKACSALHTEQGVLPLPSMSDNDGNRIEDPSPKQIAWSQLFSFLRWPFFEVIRTAETLNFADEQITSIYDQYFEHWTAVERKYKTRFPLLDFESELDEIELGEDTTISFLSNDEKTQVYKRSASRPGPFRDGLNEWDLIGCSHEGVWEYSVPHGEEKPKPQKGIYAVITTLRLFKEGSVGIRSQLTRPDPDLQHVVSSEPHPLGEMYPAGLHNKFVLLENDRRPICDLFASVSSFLSLPRRSNLGLALHRFNLSYERRGFEDKLLDLVISLECVLLPGDRAELKHRLALRASFFLKNYWEPQNTYALMDLMYQVRSNIVHGGKTLEDQLDEGGFQRKASAITEVENVSSREFYLHCESRCRTLLREILLKSEEQQDLKEMMISADQSILENISN